MHYITFNMFITRRTDKQNKQKNFNLTIYVYNKINFLLSEYIHQLVEFLIKLSEYFYLDTNIRQTLNGALA